MTTFQGAWQCAQCANSVEIPGNVHNCPTCGDPHDAFRDPSEEWYLPDNPIEITDPDELARGEVGPNWNCGTCRQSNRGDQGQCTRCDEWRGTNDNISPVTTYTDGNPRNSTVVTDGDNSLDQRYDQLIFPIHNSDDEQTTEPPSVSSITSPVDLTTKEDAYQAFPPTRREALAANTKRIASGFASMFVANKRRITVSGVAILATVGLTAGGVTVYNDHIATHPVDITVKQLSWQRTVEVEELRTLEESDWYVPSGGRLISSRPEIRSYREVFSHYEKRSRMVPERVQTGTRNERYVCGSTTKNKGNGQFEVETTYCNRWVPEYSTGYRQEQYDEPIYDRVPVYDTRYYYEIDRWVTNRHDPASGRTDPHWPTVKLGDKQRIGDERSEEYTVVLADNEGRRFTRTVDLPTWSRLSGGKVLKGEQTRQGDLRDVSWN